MVYLHPVLGVLAVAATLWLATQGLRARHQATYAAAARRNHRRAGPWISVAVWLAAAGGLLSVSLLRDDLTPASTAHGALGGSFAICMATSWMLSRRFPRARRGHVAVGLTATALALAVLVAGLRLLP